MRRYIFVLSFILLLCGCGQQADRQKYVDETVYEEEDSLDMDDSIKEEVIADNGENISEEKKYMIEKYGFTEEELEGVDLIRFIEDYQLKDREWDAEMLKQILDSQRSVYIDDGKTAIYSILSKSGGKLEKDDRFVRCALDINEGSRTRKLVIDFAEGKYYSDDIDAHSLDESKIKALKEVFDKNGVVNWEQDFVEEEKEGRSTYSFSWNIVFETEEGVFCAYKGYCSRPDSIPEYITKTIQEITKILSE